MHTENIKGLTSPEKPCLVETSQGFSVLYKERYLYSKYSPAKSVLQRVEELTILENTLVVCLSPCLGYGLEELIKKMPENCFLLCLELDENLYSLSANSLNDFIVNKSIQFIEPKHIVNIVDILLKKNFTEEYKNIPDIYNFKRAIILEMSGGTFFYNDFYKKIANTIQNTISNFWKNRLTLVKLGRLYSRNFFKNLKNINDLKSISIYKNKFTKPFLIVGAGESCENIINTLSKNNLSSFNIVAVDAILPTLQANKIIPDFIVAVESQLAIEKAYIGSKKNNSIILADLTSRKSITKYSQKDVYFFYSEYTNASFLDNAHKNNILPLKIPALGSVGLTSVYLACLLRQSEDIPIFICGLDFSYSLGTTHARGTPAHKSRLNNSDRLHSLHNYKAAFNPSAKKYTNSLGEDSYTDITLQNYRDLFYNFFYNTKNLYNLSKTGLNLGIPNVDEKVLSRIPQEVQIIITNNIPEKSENKEKRINYINEEKKALSRIKELLINGENTEPKPNPSLSIELENLIKPREYLYLHFPDGYKYQKDNISFLKRIRSEIDFFIKDLTTPW